MPFRLKNVGAMYQRLVNAMFKHYICKNVELYADDILVKRHLGVSPGKFLDFMVCRGGLSLNLRK
jgi:hypothetical protein